MGAGGRTSVALVVLGVASLLSSWNPASAPAGLLVGITTAVLCLVERRRAGRLAPVLLAALSVALAGAAASASVIGLLAGVGRGPEGRPIVEEPASGDRKDQLDRAEERTRAAREAARKELEQLGAGR